MPIPHVVFFVPSFLFLACSYPVVNSILWHIYGNFLNLPGAYLNIIKRTVKYLCPADVIPPYIDVDLSELDVGQKLLMGDLKVHPDLKLVQSKEQPVCKIMGSRVSDQQKKSK